MDHSAVKNLVQGFQLADSAISSRAQDHALEMLALLLIVRNGVKVETILNMEAVIVEASIQAYIQQVVQACIGELSLFGLLRMAEGHKQTLEGEA